MVSNLPKFMKKILNFLVENETGKQLGKGNKKIKGILTLINGIIKRDFKKIFYDLSELLIEFEMANKDQIELIKSIVFLMNKFDIPDEQKKQELIETTIKTLSEWIINLMTYEDNNKKEEFSRLIKSLISILMGVKYLKKEQIQKGLENFIPALGCMSKMINCIWTLKDHLFNNSLTIKDLTPKAIKQLIASLFGLIKMATAIEDMVTRINKAIESKKGELRVMTLPVYI